MATNDDTNCADDQPSLDAGEQIGLTLRRISEDLAQSRRELNEIRILLNNQHDASRPETAQSPPQSIPHRYRAQINVHLRQVRNLLAQRQATARAQSEWRPNHYTRWCLLVGLAMAIAAFSVRGFGLTSAPPGLQGDEATTALIAQQVLDNGWIGVYTGQAGGNPTGVYYLATVPVRLIDDPILAVRMFSAIMGVLAVVLLYILALRNFGLITAFIGSSILAFSEWHIAFSRTGCVTGSWPTVALVAAIALLEAIRTRRWYWWSIAGALSAAGMYVYNGHGPMLVLLAVFAAAGLFGWRALVLPGFLALALREPSTVTIALTLASTPLLLGKPFRIRSAWANAIGFTGAGLLVLRGLIDFILAHHNDYFGRARDLSIFRSSEWTTIHSDPDKLEFLLRRYREFWDRVVFHPVPVGVDLTGITPLIPRLMFALCVVGAVIALVRRPTPAVMLASAIVLLAPLTSVATIDLAPRRALVLIPFLALLAGAGLSEALRVIRYRLGRVATVVAAGILAVLLAFSSYQNCSDFFHTTVHAQQVRRTFAVNLRNTVEYLRTLPDGDYVYLYADGFALDHEVVRLLAPNLRGENKLPKWGGDGAFDVDFSHGQPVIVLIEQQQERLPELERLYPGGQIVTGPMVGSPINGPAYVAYFPLRPEQVRRFALPVAMIRPD